MGMDIRRSYETVSVRCATINAVFNAVFNARLLPCLGDGNAAIAVVEHREGECRRQYLSPETESPGISGA